MLVNLDHMFPTTFKTTSSEEGAAPRPRESTPLFNCYHPNNTWATALTTAELATI
ncbi:MAG: hypothetical protein AB8B99_10395 [Phormidesmis sp.]